MSDDAFRQMLVKVAEDLAAKAAKVFFCTIIPLTFAFAVWLTNLSYKLDDMAKFKMEVAARLSALEVKSSVTERDIAVIQSKSR